MKLCKLFNLGHLWERVGGHFKCIVCGKVTSGWRTWFFVPCVGSIRR